MAAAELQGGSCTHRAPAARNWLREIRESGELSDVVVRVQGQDFHLHTLPLVCASSYFRSLLLLPAHSSSPPSSSSSCTSSCSGGGYGVVIEAQASSSAASSSFVPPARNPPSDVHVVVIDLQQQKHGLSAVSGAADAFSVVADFCYLLKPRLTVRNAARVLAIAELLDMGELVNASKKFLYAHAFHHWKSAVAFLRHYSRVGVPSVDEYVESRCIRAIADKCKRAFSETRFPSVTAVARSSCTANPPPPASQVLSYVLAKLASLPDAMAETAVEAIVAGGANLHLSCRQSRNVKDWLKAAMASDCRNARERAWVIVCLTRMLQAEAEAAAEQKQDGPWLALSSHYWCALLQEACAVAKELQASSDDDDDREDMAAVEQKLAAAMAFLEERIGGSLHELDEILVSYKLEAPVMVSLVRYFRERTAAGGGAAADLSVAEVAKEVDECLWSLVDDEKFSAHDLSFLIRAFPDDSRSSHDNLYAAIEKLSDRSGGGASSEVWGLLDIRKLSDPFLEKAMRNPEMLRRTESLAYVLERQMTALEMEMEMAGRGGGGAAQTAATDDKQLIRSIMQRVVLANLKLLEENSRRAMEIMELQKLCSRLLLRKQQQVSKQEEEEEGMNRMDRHYS